MREYEKESGRSFSLFFLLLFLGGAKDGSWDETCPDEMIRRGNHALGGLLLLRVEYEDLCLKDN